MLDYSEANMELNSGDPKRELILPSLTKSEKKVEEMKHAYGANNRKTIGNAYYIDYKKFPVEKRPRPLRMKSFSLQKREQTRVPDG